MDALLNLGKYFSTEHKVVEWYEIMASALLAVFSLAVFLTGVRNFT